MAQTFAAACLSLTLGWIGFGWALAHAPADAPSQIAANQVYQQSA